MRGDPLPSKDHISRYCKPKTAPGGHPTGASFTPKEGEPYLSVNWMEYFGEADQEAQIARIRDYIELSLAKNGLFAVLNVGEVIDRIQRHAGKTLAVLHEPTQDDPSHSGIYGYQHEDMLVTELLADIVMETYPSR